MNNTIKYEVVLLGLWKAKALGSWRLFVKTDSKLVIGNVDKTFEAKGDRMKHYLEAVQAMNKAISGITI